MSLSLGLEPGLHRRRSGAAASNPMTLSDYLTYMGGSVVWLADAASATVSGGVVTAWSDSINAMALTPSGSPGYSTTGCGAYPGITFDGATQYFTNGAGALPAYLPSGTDECWLWALVNSAASDANQHDIFGYGPTGNSAGRRISRQASGGVSRGRVDRTGAGVFDTNVVFDGVHIIGGHFISGGTTIGVKVDGNTEVQGAQAFNTTTSSCRIRIGAGLAATADKFFTGNLGLAWVVAGGMSVDQISVTEGFGAGLANG